MNHVLSELGFTELGLLDHGLPEHGRPWLVVQVSVFQDSVFSMTWFSSAYLCIFRVEAPGLVLPRTWPPDKHFSITFNKRPYNCDRNWQARPNTYLRYSHNSVFSDVPQNSQINALNLLQKWYSSNCCFKMDLPLWWIFGRKWPKIDCKGFQV